MFNLILRMEDSMISKFRHFLYCLQLYILWLEIIMLWKLAWTMTMHFYHQSEIALLISVIFCKFSKNSQKYLTINPDACKQQCLRHFKNVTWMAEITFFAAFAFLLYTRLSWSDLRIEVATYILPYFCQVKGRTYLEMFQIIGEW